MLSTDTRLQLWADRVGAVTRVFHRRFVAHATALLAYTAVGYVLFGRHLSSADTYAGTGPPWDPSAFAWALGWWPYAITHGIDPFHTSYVWSGAGYDVVWMTSVPFLALVAWPITAISGPVVAYDTLMLAAPILASYCAFLLCRHITRSFVPALVGGLLFGYSAYTLAHYLGHLNLIMIWPVPLAAYVCLRWFDHSISSRRYVALLGLVLAAEFGISAEVTATLSVIALIVLAGSMMLLREYRPRIIAAAGRTLLAYVVAGVLVSPLLVGFLSAHAPGKVWDIRLLNADLLGTVIPMPTNRLGRHWFAPVARTFTAQPSETGSYIGVAALLMLIVVVARRWRTPLGVMLAVASLAATVLSFGLYLRISGAETMPMPGLLLQHLPLIGKAFPIRYDVYATLAAVVAVAVFLADASIRLGYRVVLCVAALALAVPNLTYPSWWVNDPYGPVFRSELWRRALPPHPVVFVLPFFAYTPAMAWQAQTGFGFRLVGGYTATVPAAYTRAPFTSMLVSDLGYGADPAAFAAWLASPAALNDLCVFLNMFAVNAVIVAPRPGFVDHPWGLVLDRLGGQRRIVGGLVVYSGWPHS